MKFESGRLAIVASAVVTCAFVIGGLSQHKLLAAVQQRPDKPKLQKPQQSAEEPIPQKDDDTIKIGRTIVTLDVTVVDPSNKPVMDLKQEEFIVSEDKVPQKIEFF